MKIRVSTPSRLHLVDIDPFGLGSARYPTIQEIEADGGRWAYIEDPNGIWIELF